MTADCEHLAKCPMFKCFTMDTTKQFYIGAFCRGAFARCERHKLRQRALTVPDRLLPDGQFMPPEWTKPAP